MQHACHIEIELLVAEMVLRKKRFNADRISIFRKSLSAERVFMVEQLAQVQLLTGYLLRRVVFPLRNGDEPEEHAATVYLFNRVIVKADELPEVFHSGEGFVAIFQADEVAALLLKAVQFGIGPGVGERREIPPVQSQG